MTAPTTSSVPPPASGAGRTETKAWLYWSLLLATVGPLFLAAIVAAFSDDMPKGRSIGYEAGHVLLKVCGSGEFFLAATFLLGTSLRDIQSTKRTSGDVGELTVATTLTLLAVTVLWVIVRMREAPSLPTAGLIGSVFFLISAVIAGTNVWRRAERPIT
jgi:hypothetical protein